MRDTVISGESSSLQFRSHEKSTAGVGTLSGRDPVGSGDSYGGNTDEFGIGVVTTIDLHHEKD